MLAARHPIRAWESHWYRGQRGDVIYAGFMGLVLATMSINEDTCVRFDVLALEKVFIFSTHINNFKHNWQLLTPR